MCESRDCGHNADESHKQRPVTLRFFVIMIVIGRGSTKPSNRQNSSFGDDGSDRDNTGRPLLPNTIDHENVTIVPPLASPTMLKTFLLTLTIHASLTVAAAASAASTRGRWLDSGDSGDNNSQDNNNNNNSGDNGDTDDDNVWTRIGNDTLDMWNTAPSEWITEYWEVFTVVALVASFLLCCHLYMVCDSCCFGNSNSKGEVLAGSRTTMTPERYHEFVLQQRKQLEMDRQEKELSDAELDDGDQAKTPSSPIRSDQSPIHSDKITSPVRTSVPNETTVVPIGGDSDAPTEIQSKTRDEEETPPTWTDKIYNNWIGAKRSEEQPPRSMKSASPALLSGTADEGSTTTARRNRKRPGRVTAGHLAHEVVSVWKEFLGFDDRRERNPVMEKDGLHKYKRYEEEEEDASLKKKRVQQLV